MRIGTSLAKAPENMNGVNGPGPLGGVSEAKFLKTMSQTAEPQFEVRSPNLTLSQRAPRS